MYSVPSTKFVRCLKRLQVLLLQVMPRSDSEKQFKTNPTVL